MAVEKKPAASKPVAKKPAAAKAAKTSKGLAKVKANPGKTEENGAKNMKEEFSSFKEQASDKARDAANRGKERAAEAMGGIGKIIRESADTIDEKVGKQYGDYARTAADTVDDFAHKVDAKDVDALVEDARQFIRKSPAVAIGAAAAIGFILARVIRSGRDA